jgi:Vault protein inter-alpha-trypsin domain
VPLVTTTFDVILDAGLAIVTTTRRFRNTEEASIEATITFPVPVHATLFDLAARIGERLLIAGARHRGDARDDYEGAVGAGKTAVLHEEVLRGVHMLSVAHVPPGVEVEVRSTWALTLTNGEGRGTPAHSAHRRRRLWPFPIARFR